ncbi:phosphoenolpyruvate carboxykinase (ATP) [bacterium]|nr:MAG: phosphoenolpyruvate carboxykinase (ATP) [bacterium]
MKSSAPIDLGDAAELIRNPDPARLAKDCLEIDGCRLASNGAVVAYSGKYTGRTPKDKFTVLEADTENEIWWGNNNPMNPFAFDHIREKFHAYANGKRLYVIDAYAGADPAYRIAVRIVAERPYHALFIRQLLIRPTEEELRDFQPDWHIVDFGLMPMDPGVDGTHGDAVIAMRFSERQVLIGGTQYAGEMKKSVFTVMNRLLPPQGVLSMHCSANVGEDGSTSLFFGLSGTGKTTLSADPARGLIGDDEHGWSDTGVFNIEGGCYAKCIRLSEEGEPEIWAAIREGAVLENVVLNEEGIPDYDSDSITENTRAAYPLEHISNAVQPSVGGHPKDIVFLTSDAQGVLPPISRLTPEQAMEHFLAGYTSKLAGTEMGVTEPQLVFSTCFGAPFLPLHPHVYANLLREKIARHDARVWLVNTGWTGGPYGVGHRMKLAHTRALLHHAFAGNLDAIPYEIEPVFGLHVPTTCPDIPDELLFPRNTWANPEAYDTAAAALKSKFDAALAKLNG